MTADRIAESFSALAAVSAVALSGSRTSAINDDSSDWDIYIYSDSPIARDERKRLYDSLSLASRIAISFFEEGDEAEDGEGRVFDIMFRSREWTEGNLSSTGIAGYFRLSVYGEMVSRGKPAPDIFLLAAEKLGEKPENCLVLEDSLQGNEAAINGGFVGIMVPDLTPPTEYLKQNLFAVCSSLSDVITLFETGRLYCENTAR